MTQEIAGSMMLALMVLALFGAWWGWQRRTKRYSPLTSALTLHEPTQRPSYETAALYVATTESEDPIQRIPLGPLAFRAKCTISLYPEGLSVQVPGQPAVLIPRADGLQAGLATWTIDRVVEPDGLLMVRWSLGDHVVDSYFRVVDGDAGRIIHDLNTPTKGVS